jgi:hypothetical protein
VSLALAECLSQPGHGIQPATFVLSEQVDQGLDCSARQRRARLFRVYCKLDAEAVWSVIARTVEILQTDERLAKQLSGQVQQAGRREWRPRETAASATPIPRSCRRAPSPSSARTSSWTLSELKHCRS